MSYVSGGECALEQIPSNRLPELQRSRQTFNPNQTSKPVVQYGLPQQHQQQQHQQQQQAVQPIQSQQRQVNYQQRRVEPTVPKTMAIPTIEPEPQIVQKYEAEEEDVMEHNETNDDEEKQDEVEILTEDNVFENGKLQFKKIFQNRKKSSERAREKKIRQNRQLRKAMLPKNALMALNELKGVNISDFIINSNVGGGFTAVVTVNDIQYEGRGSSKMSAKSNACEKALRDFIIAKMVAKPKKPSSVASTPVGTPVPPIIPTIVPSVEQMDMSEDAQSENDNPEDDVPMINLASFAIYKLFSEWEKDGYFVPEMHPQPPQNPNEAATGSNTVPKEPKKLPIRNELPANWETMHPATLLCMMRPGITYIDFGPFGEKPNVVQRLGVTVDDVEFEAEGRSKKIARRNVAISVCNTLFGTNFLKDEA